MTFLRKTYLLSFVIAVLTTVFFIADKRFEGKLKTLKYRASFEPTSADPIDYDLMSHHQVFRSTFSSLISQYRRGQYIGILAEAWNADENFRNWTFTIRKGIKFENGDEITPQAILKSLRRIGFLIHQRKSKEGLFSNLAGFEKIQSIGDEYHGLTATETQIKFQFTKPMPQVPELISFGLYSIVHSDNFDPETGIWNNKRNLISSGPYIISDWTSDRITLKLRENFLSNLGHPNRFQNIEILWKRDVVPENYFDIIAGDDFETLDDPEFVFAGGAKSGIQYIHCSSWKDPTSPLFSQKIRKLLRDFFYAKISNEADVTSSFFPLAIQGIRPPQTEFLVPNEPLKLPKPLKVNYARKGSKTFRAAYTKTWQELGEMFEKINIVKIDPPEVFDLNDPDLKKFSADLTLYGTNILIEFPDDDIRFMFLSKEGIRLPDVNGSMISQLQNSLLDYQNINQELWNQAIIWPISHYASGVWAKSTVDLSLLNTLKPPIDFMWVGSK